MGRWAFWLLAGLLLSGAWLFWSTSNDQSGARRAFEAAPEARPGG